jgi:hypothetical protein
MRMTRRGLQLALGVLWLLAGYSIAFSKFVAGATKLPQAAVAADLKGHVSTLEAAIKRADRPARPARSRDRIRRADRRGQCRQPEGTRGTGRRFRAQSEHRPARRRHRQRLRRARSAAVPETLERPHRLLRQLHARRRHSRQSQGCHCTEGPERLHRPVQHLHLRCHQATEIRRSRRPDRSRLHPGSSDQRDRRRQLQRQRQTADGRKPHGRNGGSTRSGHRGLDASQVHLLAPSRGMLRTGSRAASPRPVLRLRPDPAEPRKTGRTSRDALAAGADAQRQHGDVVIHAVTKFSQHGDDRGDRGVRSSRGELGGQGEKCLLAEPFPARGP